MSDSRREIAEKHSPYRKMPQGQGIARVSPMEDMLAAMSEYAAAVLEDVRGEVEQLRQKHLEFAATFDKNNHQVLASKALMIASELEKVSVLLEARATQERER